MALPEVKEDREHVANVRQLVDFAKRDPEDFKVGSLLAFIYLREYVLECRPANLITAKRIARECARLG